MDPAGLADDDLVAVVSNMGAPLVGQERLTDSLNDRPRRAGDGGRSRPSLPRRHVAWRSAAATAFSR